MNAPTEPGWYLCDRPLRGVPGEFDHEVYWWDGKYFQPTPNEVYKHIKGFEFARDCTNFRRLIEAEPCAKVLEKPADDEKIVVGGRECSIIPAGILWIIQGSPRKFLDHDGQWGDYWNRMMWPTKSAAIEFARACAGRE